MKIPSLVLISVIFLLALSGCSSSPGIPGINIAANSATKPLKNGVDFKLYIINNQTIKSQKPFDYATYIEAKRKRLTRPAIPQPNINAVQVNQYQRKTNDGLVTHNIDFKKNIALSNDKHHYKYLIGKKDILNIQIWDHPELTTSKSTGHVVDNAGQVYFPYAGHINAVGKTTREIQELITEKLKKYIAKPQVSVQVGGFRSQKAYISGAIKTSTLGISDTPLTVRDAISSAGGISLQGTTGVATLTRGSNTYTLDLNRLLKYNDNRQNYLLQNGDRLRIHEKDEYQEWLKGLNRTKQTEVALNPIKLQYELQKVRSITLLKDKIAQYRKAEFAKVFVMGEVRKPGTLSYHLPDRLTLAEAINDSGSFNEATVNPKGIFVVRKESKDDTIPTVYQLSLASVHSMLLAEQFEVRPRDIIYVTTTSSIRWNRVLNQLIPSLTLVNTISNLTR